MHVKELWDAHYRENIVSSAESIAYDLERMSKEVYELIKTAENNGTEASLAGDISHVINWGVANLRLDILHRNNGMLIHQALAEQDNE